MITYYKVYYNRNMFYILQSYIQYHTLPNTCKLLKEKEQKKGKSNHTIYQTDTVNIYRLFLFPQECMSLTVS